MEATDITEPTTATIGGTQGNQQGKDVRIDRSNGNPFGIRGRFRQRQPTKGNRFAAWITVTRLSDFPLYYNL